MAVPLNFIARLFSTSSLISMCTEATFTFCHISFTMAGSTSILQAKKSEIEKGVMRRKKGNDEFKTRVLLLGDRICFGEGPRK